MVLCKMYKCSKCEASPLVSFHMPTSGMFGFYQPRYLFLLHTNKILTFTKFILGYEVRNSTYSARIQIFLALVIGFLLYSAMNAVLVARLATFEVQLPFSNLEDILKKRTHSLCLRTNSFVFNNFTVCNILYGHKTMDSHPFLDT